MNDAQFKNRDNDPDFDLEDALHVHMREKELDDWIDVASEAARLSEVLEHGPCEDGTETRALLDACAAAGFGAACVTLAPILKMPADLLALALNGGTFKSIEELTDIVEALQKSRNASAPGSKVRQ